MKILDNLFGAHPENLRRAMAKTTLRHELLAKNLANVNTPGYKRQDVDFGIMLNEQMGTRSDSSAVRTDQGDIRQDGSSVDLETEVMAMAETELRFQTLADMTASYFAGLKNVIREGR